MRLLELRGLPVAALIDFVHRHGGILGPAHPCGEKYLSYAHTKGYYNAPEYAKRFDFFEVFNACESPESNEGAMKLAMKYQKPGVGGSDAHRPDCVGMAYTELPEPVTCETELIALIRKKENIKAAVLIIIRQRKIKWAKRISFLYILSGFIIWEEQFCAIINEIRKIDHGGIPIDPIDPIETTVDIKKHGRIS